jgi:site-specific DNA-methyltransferase (adenine-specific)
MIVSVKGGQKVGVEMVRDLRAVIERENSPIGLLVTLVEPTGPMQVEAAKAGFYKTEFGEYPRLQILTVGQLLNGHRPQLPLVDTQAMFKKAPAEKAPDMQAELAI